MSSGKRQQTQNKRERFASQNWEYSEKILTENDSENTKQSTETAVKLYKAYLGQKELLENFKAASASKFTRFFVEVKQLK